MASFLASFGLLVVAVNGLPQIVPRASSPCASVSALASSQTRASPSATPTVPADLAYECITSVPFDSSAAVQFLDSIAPYLEWQTTYEYLKDPPSEYAELIQPAYDFWANYDRIYSNAQANDYANEYAFGFDVYTLFQTAHDGHFSVYPDSVTEIFSFGRPIPLVSVSLDGESIPEVYVYQDILDTALEGEGFTPSPVTLINGEDSTDWLSDYSQIGSLQDRDALWNNLFWSSAQVSLASAGTGLGTFAGGGRGQWQYPNATTTLTFANGSSLTMENFARVLVSFNGIQDGQDIYDTYFTVNPKDVETAEEYALGTGGSGASQARAQAQVQAQASPSTSTSIPAPGYPTPYVRETNNLNSGYFLTGEGYDDVAVLSIASFVSEDDDEIPFQSVNTYFLEQAAKAGKTKLIIDVSANAGGTVLQGYDVFKQLFPSLLPYGATRFRANEAFNLIGQEASVFAGHEPRSLQTNEDIQEVVASVWNYRSDADINYEPFTSWAEKYGPNQYGPEPDNFTSIIRWNMSDVLTPYNSGGIYISGYLERSNITVQPFAAENIVIVYDGYCASTCTIFSELMTAQGGVQTIALGGRPTSDIIQAVGGVKGVNDYPFDYIFYGAGIPFYYQYLHSANYYSQTSLGDYNDLWYYRTTETVVNARDGIAQGDTTETPLQFVYQPADCRIYYTPEMTVDETAIWKTVADTAFNGIDHCVAGGLTTPSRKEKKRATTKQGVREDLSTDEHYEALTDVWTGKGGIKLRGDGIMIV